MLSGIIVNSNKVHKRKVSVNPIARHYEEPGEEPYIKYSCPVCAAVGNYGQVTEGTPNCMLCGVSLNWDRKPEMGDTVILNQILGPDFMEGFQCTIVKDNTEDPREIPYVLKRGEKQVGCGKEDFTILVEPED